MGARGKRLRLAYGKQLSGIFIIATGGRGYFRAPIVLSVWGISMSVYYKGIVLAGGSGTRLHPDNKRCFETTITLSMINQ